jgi:hypothetical protein
MKKTCIILNSHSLHNFQICEAKHSFVDVLGLVQIGETKQAFQKGIDIAKLLEIYYYRKMKKKSVVPIVGNIHLWLKRFGKYADFKTTMQMSESLISYFKEYAQENVTPIAVEKGFSKTIYEDAENHFVYEGRPDLVVKFPDGGIHIWDHKTQSRRESIYPFNNQALGYCWALNTNSFGYNYLVFTKENQIRREVFKFSQTQIDQWKEDTIKWFFRIKEARETSHYLRSWNCQGKYGICEFHKICEAPTESLKLWVAKSEFQINPEVRMSW